jgi:hypothetical protein
VEHRLRVFENRVLRKIFGPKRDKVTNRHGGECLMRSFMVYYSSPDIICVMNQDEWITCGMYRGEDSCIEGFGMET